MNTETKYCGTCIYGTGEECNGPSGSREGHEIYSDTPACECHEEIPELFPGTLAALQDLCKLKW